MAVSMLDFLKIKFKKCWTGILSLSSYSIHVLSPVLTGQKTAQSRERPNQLISSCTNRKLVFFLPKPPAHLVEYRGKIRIYFNHFAKKSVISLRRSLFFFPYSSLIQQKKVVVVVVVCHLGSITSAQIRQRNFGYAGRLAM